MKENDLSSNLLQIGINAKKSQKKLGFSKHVLRNNALKNISKNLKKNLNEIISINKKELVNAKKKNLKESFIDRLTLDKKRIESMCQSLKEIYENDDPLGKKLSSWVRPNGLKISKISTPIGVIGFIYESRPNVTIDASALAIKSGNSIILRPGSDSHLTCKFITEIIRVSLREADLPTNVVQLIPTNNRDAVGYMLGMVDYIDVIIPRGGRSLVQRVQNEAKVPVFSHLEGICHTYINKYADINKAISVTVNAKMRRTGICGATETLLIDNEIYEKFLPPIVKALKEKGCNLKGDKKSQTLVSIINEANEEDWSTEYLSSVLSIKIVDDIYDAINHISKYGTQHTEAIITENKESAEIFTKMIDSAIVMINTSTQFADGGEFGLGAEIGIATGRLHARGPVGANQLTSFKYVVHGSGQIRA